MSISAHIHPTSSVSPDAALGRNVTVGAYTVINANVSLGDGAFVDSHAVVGSPTADFYDDPEGYEPAPVRVGAGAVVRSHSVLYDGVTIGTDFGCGHHVIIREGVSIGDGVRVGAFCDLEPDARVGAYARMHSNVFVARGSTIEELTWLFPHAMLIDDPHPPSDSCTEGPTIRRFAVVGAMSTVFPAVDVGEGAVIGAMSLVRHDVPAGAVVVGVPAKVVAHAVDVECHEGRLEQVYPWWTHFRRGYPDGVLPDIPDATGGPS